MKNNLLRLELLPFFFAGFRWISVISVFLFLLRTFWKINIVTVNMNFSYLNNKKITIQCQIIDRNEWLTADYIAIDWYKNNSEWLKVTIMSFSFHDMISYLRFIFTWWIIYILIRLELLPNVWWSFPNAWLNDIKIIFYMRWIRNQSLKTL